eukprot:COSAG01_NODE_26405_length_715_cov_0.957792_1_plen_45_part_10
MRRDQARQPENALPFLAQQSGLEGRRADPNVAAGGRRINEKLRKV